MKIQVIDKFKGLYEPARYKVFYGGRGGAKSWQFADALIIQGANEKHRILCARELQNSIQESVHKLLSQRIDALGLSGFYDITQKSIKGKNGTEFFFDGVKNNVAKIKSYEGITRCWLEEADKISENSWNIIIPTIRKEGSEIWCSFNTGHKYDPTWDRFIVNPPPNYDDQGNRYAIIKKVGWQDNPYFPDELKKEMLRMKEQDYEQYLHIWEGELKIITEGAIYGKQMRDIRKDKRITRVPHQPGLEVFTFLDLGKNDSTAIWFMQKVGLEYRFIDYYENRLQDIDHYAHILREKDYLYGAHYFPHDVEFELLGMTRNRKQQFEDSGIKPIEVVPRIKHINEGIEMVRDMLPMCWFDEDKCERGIESLCNYRYHYNEDKATYNPTPVHDWASHGADAFRMFAQGFRSKNLWGNTQKKGIRKRHEADYNQDYSHII